MTASELSRLVALDISKTTEAFLDLPLPEESALIGATPKVLRRAVDNFHRSWIYLVSAKELHYEEKRHYQAQGKRSTGKIFGGDYSLLSAPITTSRFDFSYEHLKENTLLIPSQASAFQKFRNG
jgi:hypothetical protein